MCGDVAAGSVVPSDEEAPDWRVEGRGTHPGIMALSLSSSIKISSLPATNIKGPGLNAEKQADIRKGNIKRKANYIATVDHHFLKAM